MTWASKFKNPERPLGLYIHIPFCSSRCSYCDFATDLENEGDRELFLQSLLDEISFWASRKFTVDSIYFGGGTPSLLLPSELERIFEAVTKHFHLRKDSEITLEANPEGVKPESLESWSSLGINRVSLGVQTFDESSLRYLGRRHLVKENRNALKALYESDLLSFNADLMLGVPGQDENSLLESIHTLLEFQPAHVSAYMLSIEEGAPWYEAVQKGLIETGDDETVFRLFKLMIHELAKNGIEHYEISAFARPGSESKHNLKYWRNEPYLGLGPSAGSFLDPIRFQNYRSLPDWIKQVKERKKPEFYEEQVLEHTVLETVMLQFRLIQGISCKYLQVIEQNHPELKVGEKVHSLIDRGLLKVQGEYTILTQKGLRFANDVFVEFLP